MQKDFDGWNEEKKKTDLKTGRFYHKREVWWCTLGVNVGHEQDGTGKEFRRPVLILKALSRQTCLVIPLSSVRHVHPMRIPIGVIGNKEAQAIVSQMRVVDTKRFISRIDILNQEMFEEIRKAVKAML
jgi:mRNA-degrading endonuclease toxin of MazEF toxin-antitoxin module